MSLSWSATTGEVTRHAGGRRRGGRRRRLRGAGGRAGRRVRPDDQWCRLPGVRRAPRPARPPGPGPAGRRVDAALATSGGSSTRWERSAAGVRVAPSGQEPQPWAAGGRGLVPDPDPHDPAAQVPEEYAAAYARVQEQLHAGNSYEVNLTHRIEVAARPRPGGGVPAAARAQPGAVRRVPAARRAGRPGLAAQLLAGALRHRSAPTARIETRPIKGTTPRDPDPARDADAARAAGARAEVPQREPDDRRPAAQRPVDGLRAGQRRGAGPDARRVLPERPPARLDGARPAARRRHHGRGAARALPGRLDDGRAQAAHDGDHRRRRGLAARGVRRRVRLAGRRRPRRPGRGDPLADARRATAAGASAPAAASRCSPTSPRSTPSPAGRRSGCCACSAGPEPDHWRRASRCRTQPRTPGRWRPGWRAPPGWRARRPAGRTTRAGRRSRSRPGRRS